jgi:hypothetical protein
MRKTLTLLFLIILLSTSTLAQTLTQPLIKEGFAMIVYDSNNSVPILHYYGSVGAEVTCNITLENFDDAESNPYVVIWNDPDNAGKVCQWNNADAIFVNNLPKNTPLALVIAAVKAGGVQGEPSDRKPLLFNPPSKIIGVRVGVIRK